MNRFIKIEIWLGRAFLVVISFALTFAVAEWVFRNFGHGLHGSYLKEARLPESWPRPYLMFTGTPGKNGYNALGYHGPLPPMPKPGNELRILMFGGSAVHNDNDGPSLPSRLQRNL